jgi:hypothetical protein
LRTPVARFNKGSRFSLLIPIFPCYCDFSSLLSEIRKRHKTAGNAAFCARNRAQMCPFFRFFPCYGPKPRRDRFAEHCVHSHPVRWIGCIFQSLERCCLIQGLGGQHCSAEHFTVIFGASELVYSLHSLQRAKANFRESPENDFETSLIWVERIFVASRLGDLRQGSRLRHLPQPRSVRR